MAIEDDAAVTFEPIGHYKAPPLPTEHVVRRLLERARNAVSGESDDPVVGKDHLARATTELLDAVAGPPACGPLLDELDRTLREWLGDPAPASRLKVIVLPPCDRNDVVETWAREHGHRVVEPPDRQTLLRATARPALDDGGDGPIVVPRLERWFLRHRTGLAAVRALLAEFAHVERHCVIGCNSWAWAFLAKATDAAIVLPKALTLRPFDAARLQGWLSSLARADETDAMTFRLSGSGADVFAADDDGKRADRHLEQLAARSLGIPWVAWHLWRESLRTGDAPSSKKAKRLADRDDRTLWISDLDEPVLPDDREEYALLVLQALLIHDALTPGELSDVMPPEGEHDLIPSLLATGFVERSNGTIRIRPSAYPTVRRELKAAGYPVDVL